ncbi:MAG TPA: hydratase [Rubrivivax sp.]|nr:hydratase [Rubrivivax sp.]
MSPQQLLAHTDSGELWPEGGGAAFAELPAAYSAALAVEALRAARGERPRGYKIGFTNRTIWARYNVFAPIFGSVWDTTVSLCDGDGVVSLARVCQPRIEPEVVFGFKAAPPAVAGIDELFESLAWVAPGFEIVQSHMPEWKFVPAQTVADGALHARLVIGSRLPMTSVARNAAALHQALAGARVELHCGQKPVDQGSGDNVLDGPLHALLHLLTALRSTPGARPLAAGDVVTTGTWTDAWPVGPGQTWTARFDSLLPALRVSFVS